MRLCHNQRMNAWDLSKKHILWCHSDIDLWPPLTLIISHSSPSDCLCQIWRSPLKAFLRYCVQEDGTEVSTQRPPPSTFDHRKLINSSLRRKVPRGVQKSMTYGWKLLVWRHKKQQTIVETCCVVISLLSDCQTSVLYETNIEDIVSKWTHPLHEIPLWYNQTIIGISQN